MTRGVALYLVGSVVVLTLTGCQGSWMTRQEREPWRREAEVACIKSGSVKQSALIAQIKSIEGPGVCGAEYPLKVAALGDSSALGYADDLRPPGSVPNAFPAMPAGAAQPMRGYEPAPSRSYEPAPRTYEPATAERTYEPMATRGYEPAQPMGRPLSIHPPGTDPEENDTEDDLEEGPSGPAPGGNAPRQDYGRPAQSYPPAQPRYRAPADQYPDTANELPRLGPSRGPMSVAAGPTAIAPAATLACPMVSALDAWMANSVQPAAQRWFGQPVAEIKQISAYSCRGMNGQRGAPISEHAFGNALDIAAFTLADGRKVTVKGGWRGSPEEQGFLRDVHASACEQFSTVLAPGSNVFHYDHIHVDLARRRSGRSICNPAAVPGDQIAQRARERYATGRNDRMGFAPEDATGSVIELKLPRAIPGAD
jgi:hypothetical protein